LLLIARNANQIAMRGLIRVVAIAMAAARHASNNSEQFFLAGVYLAGQLNMKRMRCLL
jgi:hypothetical protein